jgi:hypothetical protein
MPFTLPVKFRQPGDTAALGMDYQLSGKLAHTAWPTIFTA